MNLNEQTITALTAKVLILEQAIQEILNVLSPELLDVETAIDLSNRLNAINFPDKKLHIQP